MNEQTDQQIKCFTKQLMRYKDEGKKVFATSSFQTHSLPMLHLLGTLAPETPVYFLNTGFLFPETHIFKDRVAADFGIRVIDWSSPVPKLQQKDGQGRLLYTSDPDECCYLNKTLPTDLLLQEYDVWISGIRRDQNANRRNMTWEAPGPHNTTRFHPMLEWTSRMIWQYRKTHGLPEHPLDSQGYLSIGCAPCTQKFDPNQGDERNARWSGMNKTECGLHTELVAK